jgi:hypothetical protein
MAGSRRPVYDIAVSCPTPCLLLRKIRVFEALDCGRIARAGPFPITEATDVVIVPTLRMYRDTSKEFATRYMWWFFLIQDG